MRAHAAGEQRIARIQEMLRRDRRGDARRRGGDESGGLRVVMCSSTIRKPGKVAHDLRQRALDENALAIEDVDVGIGDFAMQRQHDALLLHRLERGIDALERGDAGVGIRGRARGVVLDRVNEARSFRACAISAGRVLSVR